jgi:hypothetical protein
MSKRARVALLTALFMLVLLPAASWSNEVCRTIGELKGGDPRINVKATRTLGEAQDERGAGSQSNTFRYRNPSVRCQAAWSLGDIGGPRGEALITIHKDKNNQIAGKPPALPGRLTKV